MDLQITLIDDPVQFKNLESEWRELLGHSASKNIFLAWDWQWNWWDIYGNRYKLHLILVRDTEGSLLGIAPLKIARRRIFGVRPQSTVEFIGHGEDVVPEYLDFIIRKGHEYHVSHTILENLNYDKSIQGMDLKPFASDSKCLPWIREFSSSHSGYFKFSHYSTCPIVHLPETWKEYLAGKSRNFRKKLREYENRCKRDWDVTFRRCETFQEIEPDLESLNFLHNKRWRGKSRAFKSDNYIRFHKALAKSLMKRNRLRLHFMARDDRPIAAIYCFKYDDTVYYYQAGRDLEYSRHRVGFVMLQWAIKDAIREGATVFDLLTGEEDYKLRWANAAKVNLRIEYRKSKLRTALSRFRHAGFL